MTVRRATAAVVAALTALATAAAMAADGTLDGWDKARFGMTVEQVQAAYPDGRRGDFSLSLDRVRVAGPPGGALGHVPPLEWAAHFRFGEGGLIFVTLSSHSRTPEFGPMVATLTHRYGPPDTIAGRTAVWRFTNRATLTLQSESHPGRDARFSVHVAYAAPGGYPGFLPF